MIHLDVEALGVKLGYPERWHRRAVCGCDNEDTNDRWASFAHGYKPGGHTTRRASSVTCPECIEAARAAMPLLDAALEAGRAL